MTPKMLLETVIGVLSLRRLSGRELDAQMGKKGAV